MKRVKANQLRTGIDNYVFLTLIFWSKHVNSFNFLFIQTIIILLYSFSHVMSVMLMGSGAGCAICAWISKMQILRTQYKTASAAPEYCPFFLLLSNIVQIVIVFSSLVKSFSELFSIIIAHDLKELFVCLMGRLLWRKEIGPPF